MGAYQRSDFSAGWLPSADAFNCPKNGFLRADNLVLDELGAISLRQGSQKLHTVALNEIDVHSLFTIAINGVRVRFIGSGNSVSILTATGTTPLMTVTGSGDVAFGAHMGQVLIARGTTKKKYDGTTLRNWGIAPPIAAPTLSTLPAGLLTGDYNAVIVAVRNDGTYQAKSFPSAGSSIGGVAAENIRATVDAPTIAALDPQVNELWLFLKKDAPDAFNTYYRYAVLTGGPWTGAQNVDTAIDDTEALADNITVEIDNAVPPDNIIGIEGPHFDRTFVLTQQFLYPSQPLNPDSYSGAQAVRVGDATEQALWVRKTRENLYVGTTRDIYRLDGDWTVLPDGEINVVKRPLGVIRAPINTAVTVGTVQQVEILVYLASDGWRVLQGPLLTESSVDLMWRGEFRHGLGYVNVSDSNSRFRAAISKDVLFAITPEFPDTTSSPVLHAYHFRKQRWYRYKYVQAFLSIYTEPDGTLVAGDNRGYVRQLDIAERTDDGNPIQVELWTASDDNGQAFTFKDPENLSIRLDTGGSEARLNFHLNGNDVAQATRTIAQVQTDTNVLDVKDIPTFTQLQMKITGSFSTFIFRSWNLSYLDNPFPAVVHDTGPIDLSVDEFKYVRRLRIKARSPVDLTVQPIWDGEPATVRHVPIERSGLDKAAVFLVPLGRLDHGRIGRIIVTTSVPSHVYWIEFQFNGTGKEIQKRVSLLPEAS